VTRDIRRELGLRPIINASGTMTVLGASIMVPEAIAAMAAIAMPSTKVQRIMTQPIVRLPPAQRSSRRSLAPSSAPFRRTSSSASCRASSG
jgi:hypothetical protein